MSNINCEVSTSDRFTGLIFPDCCYHAHITYCMEKGKILCLIDKDTPGFCRALQGFYFLDIVSKTSVQVRLL